jgi:hypothetical protein
LYYFLERILYNIRIRSNQILIIERLDNTLAGTILSSHQYLLKHVVDKVVAGIHVLPYCYPERSSYCDGNDSTTNTNNTASPSELENTNDGFSSSASTGTNTNLQSVGSNRLSLAVVLMNDMLFYQS